MKKVLKKFFCIIAALSIMIISSAAVFADPVPLRTVKASITPIATTGVYEENHIDTLCVSVSGEGNYFVGFGTNGTIVQIYLFDEGINSWTTVFSFTASDLLESSLTPEWANNRADVANIYINVDYTFEPEAKYQIEVLDGALKAANGDENIAATAEYTGRQIVDLLPHEVSPIDKWIERLSEKDSVLYSIPIWILKNLDTINAFITKLNNDTMAVFKWLWNLIFPVNI